MGDSDTKFEVTSEGFDRNIRLPRCIIENIAEAAHKSGICIEREIELMLIEIYADHNE